MAINISDFLNGYKTHEVIFGDKQWLFREPSIKTLLSLKDQQGAEKLVKEMLLEGSYEDLEVALNELTMERKTEFLNILLKELGLR